MTASEASTIWTQKSRFSRSTPSNGQVMYVAHLKIIKSRRHIKNMYIGNFMYISLRAHHFQWPPPPLAVQVYSEIYIFPPAYENTKFLIFSISYLLIQDPLLPMAPLPQLYGFTVQYTHFLQLMRIPSFNFLVSATYFCQFLLIITAGIEAKNYKKSLHQEYSMELLRPMESKNLL